MSLPPDLLLVRPLALSLGLEEPIAVKRVDGVSHAWALGHAAPLTVALYHDRLPDLPAARHELAIVHRPTGSTLLILSPIVARHGAGPRTWAPPATKAGLAIALQAIEGMRRVFAEYSVVDPVEDTREGWEPEHRQALLELARDCLTQPQIDKAAKVARLQAREHRKALLAAGYSAQSADYKITALWPWYGRESRTRQVGER